jgi:hypothetical protein
VLQLHAGHYDGIMPKSARRRVTATELGDRSDVHSFFCKLFEILSIFNATSAAATTRRALR